MYRTQYNSGERLWSGIFLPPLHDAYTSVGQVLLRVMKTHSSKIGQICADTGSTMTYGEMYSKSVRAAQNIRKWNLKKGDVFAIISANNNELMPLLVALLCLEFPINPIPSYFVEFELLHLLNITKPKVVFCEANSYAKVEKCLFELKIDAKMYTFGGCVNGSVAASELFAVAGDLDEDEFVPSNINGAEDIAAIVTSSGTSDLPKAVSITHAHLLNSITQLVELSANDIVFTFNSPAWLGGLMMFLRNVAQSLPYVITNEAFSSKLLLEIIAKFKVSAFMTAPHYLQLMLKDDELRNADLSSVKLINVIAGKLPTNALRTINGLLPNGKIYSIYGLTEVDTVSVNTQCVKSNSVGELVPETQVKIIDANGSRLGVDESGEICVKKSSGFAGYYGNREATGTVLDGEGFIRTGDIGYFDHNGNLYVTDCIKDSITCGHSSISPSAIEDVLLENLKIENVCVVGIPVDSNRELLAAVIVRSNVADHIIEREVSDIVYEQFPEYQLSGGVYFVHSLPVTTIGKIIRRDVKLIATYFYRGQQQDVIGTNFFDYL